MIGYSENCKPDPIFILMEDFSETSGSPGMFPTMSAEQLKTVKKYKIKIKMIIFKLIYSEINFFFCNFRHC